VLSGGTSGGQLSQVPQNTAQFGRSWSESRSSWERDVQSANDGTQLGVRKQGN